MSIKKTKAHLIQLLSEPDNKVIALSGKWGTGKSHLWGEVKKGSEKTEVKNALYVSLFGLSSIDQVKLKIVQSAIPYIDQNSAWWQSAKQTLQTTTKALEGWFKSFNALNDIALLAAPTLLKGKVIVLDDIERKHNKLSVDEIMGFIDELTKQNNAKVILILNDDKLTDIALWDTLKEKVIDEAVKLETSPTEAFNIAQGLVATTYASPIEKAIISCGVTNIRIICKIIRTVNRILGDKNNLSDNMLSRVIPSTVLFSAIHFQGIDDGPSFEYVLKTRRSGVWGLKEDNPDESEETAKKHAKWNNLLGKLGIHFCDEYEKIIADFLESGLFEGGEVDKIINRYASEEKTMDANTQSRQLQEDMIWKHQMTPADLVSSAERLVDEASLLEINNVTNLYEMLSKLPGGTEVAEKILKSWIESFMERPNEFSAFEGFQVINPQIKAALDAKKAEFHAKTSIFEACRYIVQENAWGNQQTVALNSASVQDYEETIKSLGTKDLKLFMFKFIDMRLSSKTYSAYFGEASEKFVHACRNIYTNQNSGRLGQLIELLFNNAKLGHELTQPPPHH